MSRLGTAEPTAGPSWPSMLMQSKVLGKQTRAQCSHGGEVGQWPAPMGDQAHPAPEQVHKCSWCPSPQVGLGKATRRQFPDSNPGGDVPPTQSLLSQIEQSPKIHRRQMKTRGI